MLFYFATSPFFDPVSGNQSLFTQWANTPNQNDILGTRAKFEANLRHQRGIQYVVEHDPLEEKATTPGPNGPEPTNIWVIRKQNRENEKDGVTVLGYYYIVNNVIYQAPSVASILNHRLVSTNEYLGVDSYLHLNYSLTQSLHLTSYLMLQKIWRSSRLLTVTHTTSLSSRQHARPLQETHRKAGRAQWFPKVKALRLKKLQQQQPHKHKTIPLEM